MNLKKIGDNEDKNLIISILNSRLNGEFNINSFDTDDFISFNFKYKLNEYQISVLDIFESYYYSKPLVNIEYITPT